MGFRWTPSCCCACHVFGETWQRTGASPYELGDRWVNIDSNFTIAYSSSSFHLTGTTGKMRFADAVKPPFYLYWNILPQTTNTNQKFRLYFCCDANLNGPYAEYTMSPWSGGLWLGNATIYDATGTVIPHSGLELTGVVDQSWVILTLCTWYEDNGQLMASTGGFFTYSGGHAHVVPITSSGDYVGIGTDASLWSLKDDTWTETDTASGRADSVTNAFNISKSETGNCRDCLRECYNCLEDKESLYLSCTISGSSQPCENKTYSLRRVTSIPCRWDGYVRSCDSDNGTSYGYYDRYSGLTPMLAIIKQNDHYVAMLDVRSVPNTAADSYTADLGTDKPDCTALSISNFVATGGGTLTIEISNETSTPDLERGCGGCDGCGKNYPDSITVVVSNCGTVNGVDYSWMNGTYTCVHEGYTYCFCEWWDTAPSDFTGTRTSCYLISGDADDDGTLNWTVRLSSDTWYNGVWGIGLASVSFDVGESNACTSLSLSYQRPSPYYFNFSVSVS